MKNKIVSFRIEYPEGKPEVEVTRQDGSERTYMLGATSIVHDAISRMSMTSSFRVYVHTFVYPSIIISKRI